jgi:hypothetical protein
VLCFTNKQLIAAAPRTSGGAEFAAGAPAAALDAVIYCTGYEYRLPFLDLQALGLSTEQQRVAPLFQHLFVPGAPRSLAG